jgi:hypothetical protein
MVIYQSLQANKKTDPLTFRLHLIRLVEKLRLGVCSPVYRHPSIEPFPNRLTAHHFLERIPTTRRESKSEMACGVLTTRQDEGINLLVP